MANVANLRINAIVNDQATPALKRINGALTGLNRGMSGASGGALGAAQALTGIGNGASMAAVRLGVAAGAAAALVAGTMALVRASVTAAAETEGYRNTLLRLTGDAAKADATFKRLQDFADWSPFDDAAVMQSAQRLLGAGVAAEDLTRVMTALSDVSGDSAETFQRASLAFAQMALKGKVQTEELSQLAEAGIPAQRLLADAMGVSTAALAELASKGQLTANKTLPLLVQAIEQKFGGATERASQSVKGLSSTVEAKLNRSFAAFGQALEPLTKDVLRGLITVLDDVSAGVQAFTQTEEFQSFLVGVKEAWAGFLAVVRAVMPLLYEVGRVIMMMLAPALRIFGLAMQGLAYVIERVNRALKPFWDILRAVGQQIKAVIEWLTPWVAQVQQVIKAAALAVGEFFDWIASGQALRDALDLVRLVLEAINNAIMALWNAIKTAIVAFANWVDSTGILQAALNAVRFVIDGVISALNALGVIAARPRIEIDDRTAQPLANIQSNLDAVTRDPIPIGVVDTGEQARTSIQDAINGMTGGELPIGVVDVGADERSRIQGAINGMTGRTGDNAIVIETVNRTVNQVVTQSSGATQAIVSTATPSFIGGASGDPYAEASTSVRIPGGVQVVPLDQPTIEPATVGRIIPATNSLIASISNALGRWKNVEGRFGGSLGNFAMAAGGIVTRPTRALIGEAGPEAVIPLSQLGDMMGAGMNVTINVSGYADGAGAGRAAADAFRRQLGLQRRLPFGTA
jgi:tape measure domain-containing protein